MGSPHNAAATGVRDQPWVRVHGPAGPGTVTKMSKISGYGFRSLLSCRCCPMARYARSLSRYLTYLVSYFTYAYTGLWSGFAWPSEGSDALKVPEKLLIINYVDTLHFFSLIIIFLPSFFKLWFFSFFSSPLCVCQECACAKSLIVRNQELNVPFPVPGFRKHRRYARQQAAVGNGGYFNIRAFCLSVFYMLSFFHWTGSCHP